MSLLIPAAIAGAQLGANIIGSLTGPKSRLPQETIRARQILGQRSQTGMGQPARSRALGGGLQALAAGAAQQRQTAFRRSAAGGISPTSGLGQAQMGGINLAQAQGTGSIIAQLAQLDEQIKQQSAAQLAGLPPDTSGEIGGVAGVMNQISRAAPIAMQIFQQSRFDPVQAFSDYMDRYRNPAGALPDVGLDPGGEVE